MFGSNEAGIHGKGAAFIALKQFGAKWGQGLGFSGRSYAVPTKDHKIKTLPIEKIQIYVSTFLCSAEEHPDLDFYVTRLGCGLAGLQDSVIAPMFRDAPSNCLFDFEWSKYIDCRIFGPANTTIRK